MKWTATNVIAFLGFSLLLCVVAAGAVVGALFIFPKWSFFGMVSVNVKERDTQIVYCDEVLKTALAKGNIILESDNCNIEVIMNVAGNGKGGMITITEQATGVAFNSLSRTLVEWTQVLVDGEEYFKIKVLEPSGIISSNQPTTVCINLQDQSTLYNFILQNNYSKVTFLYGDKTDPKTDQLHIGNMVVRSAGSVTIPGYDTIDVEQVRLESNRSKFTCGALVKGNVTITGSSGTQSFGKINGDVDLQGNGNIFKADTTGAVDFTNLSGSLSVNHSNRLQVTTSTANVSVTTVDGGVSMVTDSGNLSVGTITSGGLDFTATTSASVSVTHLKGDAVVKNNGKGNVSLNGVDGDVDVDSCVIGGGSITVQFVGNYQHSVKILGYDGNITVGNINGKADIQVRDPGSSGAAGKANITARFNKIVGDDNVITAGAYVNSPSGIGQVNVYLNNGCNSFTLLVKAASSAWSYLQNSSGEKLTIGTEQTISHSGSASGKLTVTTPAEFRLH